MRRNLVKQDKQARVKGGRNSRCKGPAVGGKKCVAREPAKVTQKQEGIVKLDKVVV